MDENKFNAGMIKVTEELFKQMHLLSERSRNCESASEMVDLTNAMVEIARAIAFGWR